MIRSSTDESDTAHGLPRPIVKKMRWPYPLIWLVPIVAAIVAGFYFADEMKQHGPEVVIQFSDVGGLKADNSTVAHLGVSIGSIRSVALNPDQTKAQVTIRLKRSAEAFAKTGAMYWIVRPQISTGNISGLATLASGPYIEAIPGTGSPATEFVGLNDPPLSSGEGLKIVLHAPRLEHIQNGSVVYYRGVDVGVVQNVGLSSDANGIDVVLFIRQRYTRLVHANSRFWILNGADVKGGLFTGVQLKVDSLQSLISGAVGFATPDSKPGDPDGEPVAPGENFPLFNDPKKEWLEWSPRIPLPSGDQIPDKPPVALPKIEQSGHSGNNPQ